MFIGFSYLWQYTLESVYNYSNLTTSDTKLKDEEVPEEDKSVTPESRKEEQQTPTRGRANKANAAQLRVDRDRKARSSPRNTRRTSTVSTSPVPGEFMAP